MEQIQSDDPSLPQTGPISETLDSNPVEAILRITGNFYAGDININIDNEKMVINNMIIISGNLSVGTNGITISQTGFLS